MVDSLEFLPTMDPEGVSSCFWTDYFFYGLTELKYCERWADDHDHEYYNSFSALFIVGMGLYQLWWDHPYGIIQMLGGCFVINGVCSFLNHWYATRDWYIMDTTTMYIPCWILLAAILQSCHCLVISVNPTSCLNSSVMRPLVRSIIWGLVCAIIFFMLYNDMNGCDLGFLGELTFILGFAVPPVILTVLCIFMIPFSYDIIHDRYSENDSFYGHRFEQSVIYFSWGVALAILSATLWIVLELGVCPNVQDEWKQILAHIPVHAFWHIFESYALSLMMVFLVSLSALIDQIRIDARFVAVRSNRNRSPDFSLKSGYNRFIGTRCCCYCCPSYQSRTFDEVLSIIFPIPTVLYESNDSLQIGRAKTDILGRRTSDKKRDICVHKFCCKCLLLLDTTCVTREHGCCRCWIDNCVQPCCCVLPHYPIPALLDCDTSEATDLMVEEDPSLLTT